MQPRSVVNDIIHMNVIFTKEQLGRLIDELRNKVLEHFPRYCELLKLVAHKSHFLVDRRSVVRVETA